MDDSKGIRQLIRVNLELEGFEVVTAADGAECLDVVHHVRPDVVTLDVVMPRLNGLHTAARLRADPRTWDIPIAIISACTQGETDSGEAVGVDAFLSKPFEPVEMVQTVARLARKGRRPTADGDTAVADRLAAERAAGMALVRQQPGLTEHVAHLDCGDHLDRQDHLAPYGGRERYHGWRGDLGDRRASS
ncbi:PleD family two-component system response regulator [Streptomyces sp. NBC_01525]|uniref:response regulator n=1 Tax=Streptomyces sp. NBC_01525 TaxID=2903893 RepID=UPI0038672EE2